MWLDVVILVLDKEVYKVGEMVKLSINSFYVGDVIIMVEFD